MHYGRIIFGIFVTLLGTKADSFAQGASQVQRISPPQTISQLAARDLMCGRKSITIKQEGLSIGVVRFTASGCGKSIVYRVPATLQLMRECEGRCWCTARGSCARHCPTENHPAGGTYCCEYECIQYECKDCE
jgi:hypothetical protein